MNTKELSDVKVADFTQVLVGPYCTNMMAARGADVVKIEPPGGEHQRTLLPIRDGCSVYFGMVNAGKRSVTIDLRTPSGVEAARAIIESADVLVENFRPGVMAKFGLDYKSVAAWHPELVYCSITGFGQDGPWAERPAFAQVIHAMSGYDLALLEVQRDQDGPLTPGPYIADVLGGALAFGGILAGLHARRLTGEGRYVDLSMYDGMLTAMPGEISGVQFPDLYHRRNYPPYKTLDGYVMISPVNQRNFEAMARGMDSPDLITDPRFCTNPQRWRNTAQLEVIVADWASARTTEECERAMIDAGAAAAGYLRVEDAMNSEHCALRGTFIEASDDAGSYRIVDSPYRFSSPSHELDRGEQRGPVRVPRPGEHSREVLVELMGHRDAARLIDSGGVMDDAGRAPTTVGSGGPAAAPVTTSR
jgi:CoA:oxalate CoA-transferase